MVLLARKALWGHLTRGAGLAPAIPAPFLSAAILSPPAESMLLRYARLARFSNRSLSADVGRLGGANILVVGAESFSSRTDEVRRSASTMTSIWERASRDWAVPDAPRVESSQTISERILSGLKASSFTETMRLDMLNGSGCSSVSQSPSTVLSSPIAVLSSTVSLSPSTSWISIAPSAPGLCVVDASALWGRGWTSWTSLEFLHCTRRDSDSIRRF
mmetsp:Transcript_38903/g.99383  ORF Transcript_38903/g.99383 Transcript_38903/m.99383 type:complete len:217 (+) Transcript_38903:951-1601(+)